LKDSTSVFHDHVRHHWLESNEAEYAVPDSMHGPWKVMGNPCCGPNAERTFDSQNTFHFFVAGKPDNAIFMADRWNKDDLRDSRSVWLPLKIDNEKLTVEWCNSWRLDEL
jgi:beta-galactosidase